MDNEKLSLSRIKEDFFASLMLLTRIPIKWEKISPETPPNLNRCLWCYPIIGLIVSCITAAVYYIAIWINIPQVVSAIIAIITMIFITGSFHEDGLADVADGFGGGNTIEKKLSIMRDSRIGTYGSVALITSLILKIAILAKFETQQTVIALIISGVFSRLMILYILLILKPARSDSLSSEAGKPAPSSLVIATFASMLIAAALINPTIVIYIFMISISATIVLSIIAHRQISGYSGDVLGATQQISELSVYIFFSSLWNIA